MASNVITRRALAGVGAALAWTQAAAKPSKDKKHGKKRRRDKPTGGTPMAGQGIIEMTRESFDEMPQPEDEYLGQLVYVREDADQSSFLAYGRIDIAGDSEWIVVADTFQVSFLGTTQTLTNLTVVVPVGDQIGVDLTDYTEYKLATYVKTAGVDGRIAIEGDNDGTGAYAAFTITNYLLLNATGAQQTDWEPIPSGLRGPIGIRARASNGNGSEDPVIFTLIAYFRR